MGTSGTKYQQVISKKGNHGDVKSRKRKAECTAGPSAKIRKTENLEEESAFSESIEEVMEFCDFEDATLDVQELTFKFSKLSLENSSYSDS